MPQASFNKINDFMEQVARGTHKLHSPASGGHTLKIFLTNRQPLATDTVKDGTVVEIAAGAGYFAGGESVQNSLTRSSGTTSILGVDITWSAVGGSIGPFQHVYLYNDTDPSKHVIGWWSYPVALTVFDGETFTTDFGTSLFTLV